MKINGEKWQFPGSKWWEGLRLALMDYEICVKNQKEDPNVLLDLFVSKLTIQNMSHCGRAPGQRNYAGTLQTGQGVSPALAI